MSEVAGDLVNLLGLPRTELEAFVAERFGAKPFRARQLMKWLYRRGVADFAAMTDLARSSARSSPNRDCHGAGDRRGAAIDRRHA